MKKINRFLAALLSIIVIFGSQSVYAVQTDYVLDGDEERAIPQAYTHQKTISLGALTGKDLNSPQDMFIDREGKLYIADTGNNRVVVLSAQGEFIKEITAANGVNLQKPQGVFVDDYGHLFIADSSNGRILHISDSGEFIEEFGKPQAEELASIELYTPTKVVFGDNTGFLYTILGKELLTLDANNNFKGYFAANKLGFNLKNLIIRMFASKEQKKKIARVEPVAFNNIHYADNRIYGVSAGGKDNIKVINSVGSNLFPNGSYGEYEIAEDTGLLEEPILIDIAANSYGIVTVAQENNSKLYQYDMDGNLLAVFGGEGKTAGYFDLISSIAFAPDGSLYVLDASEKNIQILKPTRFITLLHQANSLYEKGDYDNALTALTEVKELAPSYKLVREKIGDIYFKQKNFDAAMEEYRISEALGKYGEAFEKSRYELFNQNFLLVVLCVALIFAAVIIAVSKASKLAKRAETILYFENPSPVKTALWLMPLTMFHPVRAFEIIKRNRKSLGFAPAFILIALTCVMRILQIYLSNYTVSTTTPENTSLALEVGFIALPVLVFAVICYLVTSLQLGECTFKEMLLNCSYSLLPAIVFLPVLTAFSWAVGASEAVFYNLATAVVIAWVLLLICVSVSQSNQYSFFKTVGVVLLSIIAIVLVAAVILLFISMSAYVVTSIEQIIQEARSLG